MFLIQFKQPIGIKDKTYHNKEQNCKLIIINIINFGNPNKAKSKVAIVLINKKIDINFLVGFTINLNCIFGPIKKKVEVIHIQFPHVYHIANHFSPPNINDKI